MDKPTEPQPLDDLFRGKLNDASVQPSTEGWLRFQSRLTEQPLIVAEKPARRIGLAWYWSASAAAACLLLVFLWTGWNGQPISETAKRDLVVTTKTGKAITQQPNLNKEPTPLTNENDRIVRRSTEKTEPVIDQQEQTPQSEKVSNILYENGIVGSKTTQKTEIEQLKLITKTTKKQPNENETQPQLEVPTTERILIVSVSEPITPGLMPTETAVPQSENSVVGRETPVKNARITRVFRQIKRLKEGEVLAKADINANETDDESGLFNRLIQSTRAKENQTKQQKP